MIITRNILSFARWKVGRRLSHHSRILSSNMAHKTETLKTAWPYLHTFRHNTRDRESNKKYESYDVLWHKANRAADVTMQLQRSAKKSIFCHIITVLNGHSSSIKNIGKVMLEIIDSNRPRSSRRWTGDIWTDASSHALYRSTFKNRK